MHRRPRHREAYLALARLYKTKKKSDRAHECFTEAKRLFEECEAGVFLDQAKDALESL